MASPSRDLAVNLVGNTRGLAAGFRGIGGTFRRIGRTAGLALAGGVAATFAVGAKGVLAGVDFDRQMREVFTLLPDISGEAMGEMRQQVKDFAVEFGVLPKDVIPALYQAISAGVPRDNVFDFLEVANKAAKGGATDLETAVDGITTATNSYGIEVLSATEASDLMFTAVRGGKTTFEELSASLFNVLPTASSLGVEFGDVTAALAAMTSQGVPTAQATTQMRQAFIELSKEGGKTAELFQELSGQTFQEFIASGGNTQEALQLLEQHAAETGVSVSDLFASVEAGQAALALTGEGTEKFSAELDAAANAAGATDAAFATMDQGLGPMIDRLKALGAVALISIGEFLIPKIEAAVEFVKQHWPEISAVVNRVKDTLASAIGFVVDNVLPPLVTAFKAVVDWVGRNWGTISDAVGDVMDAVQGALEWASNNKEVVIGALSGIAAGIMTILVPALIAWAIHAGIAAAATLVALAPFLALFAGLVAVGVAFGFLFKHSRAFRDMLAIVGRFLTGPFWDAVSSVNRLLFEGLGGAFEFVKNIIKDPKKFFGNVLKGFAALPGLIKDAVGDLLGTLKIKGRALLNGLWNGISEFWRDEIKPWLKGLPERAKGAIGDLIGTLKAKGRILISGLLIGLTDRVKNVRDWIKGLPDRIVTWIGDLIGFLKPKGRILISGLLIGLTDRVKNVRDWIKGLPDRVVIWIGDVGEALLQKGKDLIQGFLDGVEEKAGDAALFIPRKLQEMFGGTAFEIPVSVMFSARMSGLTSKLINFAFAGIPIPLSFGFSGLFRLHDGGIVPGRRGQEVPALLEAGERVIPADQVSSAGGGGGHFTQNVTVNMPPGSNGDDVLAALQRLQRRRGPLPLRVA